MFWQNEPMKRSPAKRPAVFVCLGMLLLQPGLGMPQDAEDSLERSYAQELPRIPALEPDEALGAFEVHPEFRMDLVAAEPLVHDPIAMAFDAAGDLYVVEMRGYSEQHDESLGAVRLLRDTDGDGAFDESHVFLDGLEWPTAVACWDGGVFIGVPPDILYAKDTNGDHEADLVETVYTGFHLTNVQGMLNSFKWGLDHRIHGATSSSGAAVVPGGQPDASPLTLRGRDFSFDPRSRDIRAESGGGQHGLTFDEWGRKFVCQNSHQVIYVAYEDRYVARNPYLAAPAAAIDAAADGPSGDVFRISPVEPWRLVRTRLRVKGLVPGPIEGGGTAAGYFTSATGITVYKGDAWPESYRGNLIIGDVGSNLIHRKTVAWPGIIPVTDRARADTEFVRSTDNWFRPVQFSNGPDGALYVADMYREVIEHPDSLPPIIKQHLDLTSGQDRGRIYRIVPRGFEQPPVPDLAHADTATLVDLLAHPNAWHRETASRLLFERQNQAAAPTLAERVADAPSPLGRVSALYTQDGLNTLSPETVAGSLQDPDPRVREHAVRLAARFLPGRTDLAKRLAALTDDPDLLVRYRLAFVLGYASPNVAAPALAELARRDPGDSWMRNAVLSSTAPMAADLLRLLLAGERPRGDGNARAWLEPLALQVGAAAREADVARTLSLLEALPVDEEPLAQAAVRGVIEGSRLGRRTGRINRLINGSLFAAGVLEDLLAQARETAADGGAGTDARAEALRRLALDSYEAAAPTLASALDPRQPLEVQEAAASTLARFADDDVATLFLERWPTLSPQVRSHVVEGLFASEGRLEHLVTALQAGTFPPTDLDSTRVRQLLSHPNAALRERARGILEEHALGPRHEVVAAYQDVLTLTGDPARGRAVFEQNCARCHQLGGLGHAVGPDLRTVAQAGPEQVLVNVLDPNREVNPQYIDYLIDTTDWATYSGIIASETATSLTLRRAGGVEDTILRRNIETIRTTDLSIMPEGWEQSLSRENLADLIAFITESSE